MGGFNGKKAAPFVKGGGRSKAHPNDAKGRKRKQALAVLKKAKGADLATGVSGDEIDLDWAAWNAAHKGKNNFAGAKKTRTAVKSGVAPSLIRSFKKSVAGTNNSLTLGKRSQAALERRSKMPGHFRAKAILAAQSGDKVMAARYQAKMVHARAARQSARPPRQAAPVRPVSTSVPKVKSAPRPKATRPRVAPKYRLAAKNARAHATAQRANRNLSNEAAFNIDLAFRYRHGWIKIGPSEDPAAGMKAAVKATKGRKAQWTMGHDNGYDDAAHGKRARSDVGDDMYGLGYQRGYAKFFDETRHKATSEELTKAVEQRRMWAQQMRRIAAKDAPASKARQILGKAESALKAGNVDPYGHEGLGEKVGKVNAEVRKPGDVFHIVKDPPRTKVPKVKTAKVSKTRARARDVLARIKSDAPVLNLWGS